MSGVPGDQDGCPTVPAATRNGCPHIIIDDRPEAVPAPKIVFAPNSAAVANEANQTLQKIADVLHDHADITLLHVIGNADMTEWRADELGRKRAEAVVSALVTRGVGHTRLVAPPDAHRAAPRVSCPFS